MTDHDAMSPEELAGPWPATWDDAVLAPAFIVNLDRRPDRLAWTVNRVREAGFQNVRRVRAIDGRDPEMLAQAWEQLGNPPFHPGEPLFTQQPGRQGCYLSMVLLLRWIVENDIPLATIFEDDALFHSRWDELAPAFYAETPRDIDLLYLGGAAEIWEDGDGEDFLPRADWLPPLRGSADWSRSSRILRTPTYKTGAFMITQAGARLMLEAIDTSEGGVYAIDNMLNHAQRRALAGVPGAALAWATWNATNDPDPALVWLPVQTEGEHGLVVQHAELGTDVDPRWLNYINPRVAQARAEAEAAGTELPPPADARMPLLGEVVPALDLLTGDTWLEGAASIAPGWNVLFQRSVADFYERKFAEGRLACDLLMNDPDAPALYRDNARRNAVHYAQRLDERVDGYRFREVTSLVPENCSVATPLLAPDEHGALLIVRQTWDEDPRREELAVVRIDRRGQVTGQARAIDEEAGGGPALLDRFPSIRSRAGDAAPGSQPRIDGDRDTCDRWVTASTDRGTVTIGSLGPTVVVEVDRERGEVAIVRSHPAPLGFDAFDQATNLVRDGEDWLSLVRERIVWDQGNVTTLHRLVRFDPEFRATHLSHPFRFGIGDDERATGFIRHPGDEFVTPIDGERALIAIDAGDGSIWLAEAPIPALCGLLMPIEQVAKVRPLVAPHTLARSGLLGPRAELDALIATIDVSDAPASWSRMPDLHRRVSALQQKISDGVEVARMLAFGPQPTAPLVSVVIPVYRTTEFLDRQLAAFAADPEARDLEIIYVIDSPEAEAGIVEAMDLAHLRWAVPFRVLVMNRNSGYARANNAGAAQARAERILLLNSDAWPRGAGWMHRMIRFMDERPAAGLIGPKLLYPDLRVHGDGTCWARNGVLGSWGWHTAHWGVDRMDPDVLEPRAMPAMGTASVMVRTERFAAVHGFNEEYVIGQFEDCDLSCRLSAAGFDHWYCPEVEFLHAEARSYLGPERKQHQLYNAWLFNERWGAVLDSME